jgi:amino acid adenylation domain-containing protein
MNTMQASTRQHPDNFVAHMRDQAVARPSDTALITVRERDGVPVDTVITYAELDRRVRAVAASLQSRFAAGERALLLLDNDDHYVVAFLACLYAGVIAVPVFPPESARPQHLSRLTGIAQDAQACCVLSTAAMLARLGSAMSSFDGCEALAVDAVGVHVNADADAGAGADEVRAWRPHAPQGDDIAFLQYTSGSTSTPKGVMVSHAQLMANERAIEEGLGVVPDDVFVSWLPLYHDMGLIGALLQSLHAGIPIALMTPTFFLERPARWLEAIDRLRGTLSGGPDFAYRLCIERIGEAQKAALDLSSWRLAFSGAEPVRHDTLLDFVADFTPAGFDAGALFPCYGLAEATLFVTGGRRGSGMTARAWSPLALAQGRAREEAGGTVLVSCGAPPSAHAIDIVDPYTLAPLVDGGVGEVWASGPSMAGGYWKRPQESAQSFIERDGQRWLRTGDLGFVHQGSLYIAGRIKDLIILRGQNIYPQDVERAVEAEVEVVRKGRTAVFAVHLANGREGVGLAVEVSPGMRKLVSAQAMVEALSLAVASVCREPASVILLLNPGGLPKTSSGKLQRSACRDGWLRRTLDAHAIWEEGGFVWGGSAVAPQGGTPVRTGSDNAPAQALDEVGRTLSVLWRQSLKMDHEPQPDAHFFACGGNSLAAVQLAVHIADRWHIDFPVRLVFEHARLNELRAAVGHALAAGGQRSRGERAVIPLIAAPQRNGPLPLSHAQERQWFLWQLDPQSSAYHVSAALSLEGELNVQALHGALDGLVASHEALRTVFGAAEDGSPSQYIRDAMAVEMPIFVVEGPLGAVPVDVGVMGDALMIGETGAAPEDVLDAHVRLAIRRIATPPFNLCEGPLLRTALIRADARRHVLVLVMHHIVSDGASMQVFVDELAGRYAAAVQGRSWPMGEAARVQHVDHAVWQRAWLADGEAVRQLNWWRAQLGERHPVLAMPVDRPRSAEMSYSVARQAVALPDSLVSALRRRSEAQGLTLFMTLLGALQGVLHRWTNQSDIRIGVPVANRQRPEVQGVIGLFVNTLVLRNEVHAESSLSQLMAGAREAALGAQAHQDLPFEQLVEALQPERSLSHSPLFQVMFNHLRQDSSALAQLPGLHVQAKALSDLTNKAAQFELVLDSVEHADGRVQASFIYAAELFEPQTIERLASHYVALLQAWVDDADQALGQAQLMDSAEQALLSEWCGSGQESAAAALDAHWLPVHEAIARHARSQPDATALVFGTDTLSYTELERRANRLAHHLIAQGVGPETLVGVALARSLEMVVGLLGILKAGAAWVPLDMDYPPQRLAYMAQDSGVKLVLTHSALLGEAPLQALAPHHTLLALDTLDLSESSKDEHQDPHQAPPLVKVHGEQLAYVIYTSGSTGKPKGAANRHGALASCMAWMQAKYRLSRNDGQQPDAVLHKAPFGFDVSVWEIFWPLTAGVKLVLAQPGDQRDPQRIVQLIRQHGITTVNFVPSMLQAFLAHEGIEAQTRLRHIICGGEAMPASVQEETLARLPCASLQNLYGPTEATIHVTQWTCQADGRSHVPIGRPIDGVTAHVLDERMNPAPIGVAGELYLGGIHLGRGYLGRPGLTAERFVANPLSAQGERLYRTGDLVRWSAQGQLAYLGRLDHQVKLRGLRIELGEIEAQLQAQQGVKEAVVVAQGELVQTRQAGQASQGDEVGDGMAAMRLVAYVSAQGGAQLETAQLRRALLQTLPDYMVPSVIVELPALPLNANGKVDRKALPRVDAQAMLASRRTTQGSTQGTTRGATQTHEAPQGDTEQALAAIWAEVLGLDPARIGRHDNFFEIGGHSLLAIRITTLMTQRHGSQLALKQFFAMPTVKALASHLLAHSPIGTASDKSQRLSEMDRLLNEFEV